MNDDSRESTEVTILKRALLEIKDLRARLGAEGSRRLEPVAVIGMACRFPGGADTPEEFWRILRDGVDAVREVPVDRWDVDAYYDPDPDAPGKSYTRYGAFLDTVDQFDPEFFRVSPREAGSMDPQHRLLLEVTWEALERAGQAADMLVGSSTGVFIGLSTTDYLHLQAEEGDPGRFDVYTATGNPLNFAAGRISYFLGLQGPCLALDAACASSLVTVHFACQSLRNRECDMALAGGVNLILAPYGHILLSRSRAMSPDGRCKAFDASADGMGRGEGCGIVVLKRLSDAERDADNILAVILASSTAQDGASSGLTVPNGQAQQALIRQALLRAGIAPAQVGYVEAHGTGTSLGDPIEMRALDAVMREGRGDEDPLVVASAKTNVAHTEAAAGIAGLIKTVLVVQKGEIPPHLHFRQRSPSISWDSMRVTIPTRVTPWPKHRDPRIAGVSSFGLSGTLAHALVAQPPAPKQMARSKERPLHLLALSARNSAALEQLTQKYASFLPTQSEESIGDICFTANAGRSHFEYRLAVADSSLAEMCKKLESSRLKLGEKKESGSSRKPRIAFLFTGQGSQYEGMGRELFETHEKFRSLMERCDQVLRPELEVPLLEVLYGNEGRLLQETTYTQTALFALEFALSELWRSWGVEPEVLLGHSVGELAAACAAGAFGLEDGLKLVAHRGRLMRTAPGEGAMAAVMADERQVAEWISQKGAAVEIAAVNAPGETVVSGRYDAVDDFLMCIHPLGVRAERLAVAHAFHSQLMDPILDRLESIAAKIQYSVPRVDVISNLTGQHATSSDLSTPAYWRRHARQPVRFSAGIQTALEAGVDIFIEVGPGSALLGLARAGSVSGRTIQLLPSLRKGREWRQILQSLGCVYESGGDIDWRAFDEPYARRKVTLPTYPFQRRRCWYREAGQSTRSHSRETARQSEGAENTSCYAVSYVPDSGGEEAYQTDGVKRCLVFSDGTGVGDELAAGLRKKGSICLSIRAGREYQELEGGSYVLDPYKPQHFQRLLDRLAIDAGGDTTSIVHLWGLDVPPAKDLDLPSLHSSQIVASGSVLHLAQALAARRRTGPARLWVVTRGAQPMDSDTGCMGLAAATLWGLGRALALEHPEFWGGLMDLDPETSAQDCAALLCRELYRSDKPQLVCRKSRLYGVCLVRVDTASGSSRELNVRDNASYVITGGLGGLGLETADWLARKGARHLVLLGRTCAGESVRARVADLTGSGVNVVVKQCDISVAPSLGEVFREIETAMPPLGGIIHAAGVLDDGVLLRQDWKRFENVFSPKVQGAWVLHQLTRGMGLDFFVLYSSAASIFGSPGQCNYAAANSFLDALAAYRRSEGLPALAINWGPWDGVGMAARKARRADASPLQGKIAPSAGLKALEEALRRNANQLIVLPPESSRFLSGLRSGEETALVSGLSAALLNKTLTSVETEGGKEIRRSILSATPERRPGLIEEYLRRKVAGILETEPGGLSGDDNLLEKGFDSLMVVELLRSLERDAGLTLYPREFYERPSLNALSRYISRELTRQSGVEHADPVKVLPSEEVADLGKHSSATPDSDRAIRAQTRLSRQIVFLLSSPRAGSTLLRVMLAGHPGFFCPPELHLLPFGTMAERRDGLRGSYLEEGLQRALMQLLDLSAKSSRVRLEEWETAALSIRDTYASLQQLAGARVLVDKSPSYAGSLATLRRAEQLFEDARYIHLVRHPCAVIESIVRNRMDRLIVKEEADPYQVAEQVWTISNRNIIEFLRGIEESRWRRVYYEELVRQPREILQDLCEFLGVDFDESVLRPYDGERMTGGVHPASLPIGDPRFLSHKEIEPELADAWRNSESLPPLSRETLLTARKLNYNLSDGDASQLLRQAEASSAESQMVEMQERFLDARGLPLCLCSWGVRGGPVILCLHGILEQGASWVFAAKTMAAAGFYVVAPDQRGHGRSGHVGRGGTYHPIDFLADIDCVVRDLPDGPVTLVGHSMGAALAAMYAAIRPERVGAVVLAECPYPSDTDGKGGLEQICVQLDYLASPPEHPIFADAIEAADRLRMGTPSLKKDDALMLAQRITKPCQGGVQWTWDPAIRTRGGVAFGLMGGLDASLYVELLGSIRAPVTLVYGGSSRFLRDDLKDKQRGAMPGSVSHTLPGDHNLHFDAPEALAQIVVEAARRSRVD